MKEGYNMAIVLTNGIYYIAHDATGTVIKVSDISKAQDFHTVERAIRQKNKSPKKCAGYYWIDTTGAESDPLQKITTKRKSFSANDRIKIYRKTQGRCYLCGEFVDYDSFEIEHKIPLAKGGTNDFSNLFPACHCCNTIKHDIYPQELMEKIVKIFMYQVREKGSNKTKHIVARKIINSFDIGNKSSNQLKLQIACKLIESVE